MRAGLVFFFPLVLVVLLWGCGRAPVPPDAATGEAAADAGGAAADTSVWRPAGATRRFRGADLSNLVDGAADAYIKFGFVEASADVLSDGEGREIEVIRFEMATPDAARAALDHDSGPGDETLPIGDQALRGPMVVIARRGPIYAKAQGYDMSAAVERELARAAERALAE